MSWPYIVPTEIETERERENATGHDPFLFIRLTCPKRQSHSCLGSNDDDDCKRFLSHRAIVGSVSLGCRWLYFPPLISSDPTQEIRATIHSETTQCIAALMAFLLCLITTAERGRRRAAIKSFPPNYHPFQQNCVSKARTHNGYYDMALGFSNNVSGQRRWFNSTQSIPSHDACQPFSGLDNNNNNNILNKQAIFTALTAFDEGKVIKSQVLADLFFFIFSGSFFIYLPPSFLSSVIFGWAHIFILLSVLLSPTPPAFRTKWGFG